MRKNFTAREIKVMNKLVDKLTLTDIADVFDTSVSTISYHTNPESKMRKNIYDKIYNKGRYSVLKQFKNNNKKEN